ncbi:TetR/AcrR family transcriptional regulator [Cohnella sp. GCM10027633]|uniref:TetR/AcrR family transcriptional regulator n=1 Tax=unclassified Cohnella TaxID=2636738 RepID=UPI003625AD17
MTDADKRDRIITAAYEVLAKQGYDRASTKEIAATAGVAQGLINYYFQSKDLLFAEVFRREAERYCNSIDKLLDFDRKGPLDVEAISGLLEVPKQRAIEDPEWSKLRYELFAIGLRNDAAMPILREMLQLQGNHFRKTMETLTGFPPEVAGPISSVLHATIEGLALQRIADPSFHYDEAYAMLAKMLGAFYLSLVSEKRES